VSTSPKKWVLATHSRRFSFRREIELFSPVPLGLAPGTKGRSNAPVE
jgi:hypothetical protein